MLAELLARLGIEKTALGKALGVNYLAINRWTNNVHFNEQNQARVIAALKLDSNYFTYELEKIRRERTAYREAVFERFTETKIGKTVSVEEWADLLRLPERITVTIEYLNATVLAMRGVVPTSEVRHATRAQRKLLKEE